MSVSPFPSSATVEQEMRLLELSRGTSSLTRGRSYYEDGEEGGDALSFGDRQELLGFLQSLERLEQAQRGRPEQKRFTISPRVAIARMFRVYVMSKEADSGFQEAAGEEYRIAARASRGLVGLQRQAQRFLAEERRRELLERSVDPPP